MENNEIKPEVTAETTTNQFSKVKAMGVKCCAGVTKHKNYIFGFVVLLLIVGYGVNEKYPDVFSKMFSKNISAEEVKTKLTNFIEGNLVEPGTKIEIKSVVKENGMYKVVLSIESQEITSYLSLDGKVFFPQGAMEIEKVEAEIKNKKQAEAPKEIPKNDTPEVKLFVMSYCPYGTQMEKGILPVIAALGSKIKYTLEFVDYIMHGDKEIAENLTQYCIQKNQPTKLSGYLTCFLKKGEGTTNSCMASVGINAAQVAKCVTETDTQFNIKKDAADKSKWSNAQFPPFNVNKEGNDAYGVQGSPTLVINGVVAQSAGRDAANILQTICGAFNNPPKECLAKLSTIAPAPGFGEGAAAAAGAAPASCATPTAQ